MTETLWIFGYGSLIWDPGFTPVETRRARLDGWRRAFCMRSIHFRGTPQAPGLVLALDAAVGASCHGVALRVAADEQAEVLAELRARELISNAYLERCLPVTCEHGERLQTVAYVVDRSGPQYCALDPEEQAQVIARATGGRGPNREYLFNTARHLGEIGLPDPALDWLSARVRELTT